MGGLLVRTGRRSYSCASMSRSVPGQQRGPGLPGPAGTLVAVTALASAETVTHLALLPGFLEPVTLLNSFGSWTLAGLLLVVFIKSGLLFPLLPGDSLLF